MVTSFISCFDELFQFFEIKQRFFERLFHSQSLNYIQPNPTQKLNLIILMNYSDEHQWMECNLGVQHWSATLECNNEVQRTLQLIHPLIDPSQMFIDLFSIFSHKTCFHERSTRGSRMRFQVVFLRSTPQLIRNKTHLYLNFAFYFLPMIIIYFFNNAAI